MSRANREWTTAKFERYRKERRGEGRGENYIPWNKIQELPSTSRVSRPPSWKTNRAHHLFSVNNRISIKLCDFSKILHLAISVNTALSAFMRYA